MISYAQNFEDVMLWRALKNVKNGFYVDVGAGRPELDSVTKHFYEQGWHGINIEPHSDDFSLLAAARPRDVNLKIAIGPQKGAMTFYENKIRGWSTLDRGTATKMLGLGGDSVEVQVECLPLREILDQYSDGPIHFLKIDVEGYEEEALKTLDLNKTRPWIIVLEAADIHARLPDPSKSFPQLLKNGYEFVYTDALNFFYVSQEKSEELKPHFQKPPNIFDGFVHINSRDHQQHAQYQDLRNLICQEQASGEALKTEIVGLVQNHKELRSELDSAKKKLAANGKLTEEISKELGDSLSDVKAELGKLTEANLLDQVLFKDLAAQLNETRKEEAARGQELKQELEAQKAATSKGVKELGDSLVGFKQELGAQKVATAKEAKELGDQLAGLKQELGAQKVAAAKEAKELGDQLAALKQELIHELRGLVGGLNERQDQLQQKNLAEMAALKTSLEDRLGKNERDLMDLAKYAEQIQDSVVAPSSYLIPAPFSWYSYLYKMLNIQKPSWLIKKRKSENSSNKPGFWRRLERSIRKRRKRLFARIGFDREWYLQEYPEVGPSGIDPLDHYVRFGMQEGRWKSQKQKDRADLVAGSNKKRLGFWRRLEISIRKRRKRWIAYWTFDPVWYLEAYPEVRAAGVEPLHHYVSFGKKEGRKKRGPETGLTKIIWQALKAACGFAPLAKANCSLDEIEGPWWILKAEIQRPTGYWGRYHLRIRCGGRETFLDRPGIQAGSTVRLRHLLKLPFGPATLRLDWSEEGIGKHKTFETSCHVREHYPIDQEKILAHPVNGQTDMTVMPKYGFWRHLEKRVRAQRKAMLKKINKQSPAADSQGINLPSNGSGANGRSAVPRLFVDISPIVDVVRMDGVARVTRTVISLLAGKQEQDFDVVPVYSGERGRGFFRAHSPSGEKHLWEKAPEGEPGIRPQAGDIFLGLGLNQEGVCAHADLLSQWADEGVAVMFYVYDLLPIQYPQFWPLEAQADILHHEWLSIVTSFDEVICISETTANRCREFMQGKYPPRFPYRSRMERAPARLGSRKAEISAIPLGCDFESEPLSKGLPENAEELLQKFRSKPTFLMVGTLEPRKGHQQMLEIFEQLWNQDEDVQLVIVGRHGWLMGEFLEKLKTHGELSKRLYWLPKASDEFLAKIYEACTCLLAGSIDEGYGLPLVEAIQRNKPVLARNIEVFREIGGLNIRYFKDNKNEFVGYINEIRQGDCLKNKTAGKFKNWKTHVQKLKNKIDNKGKTKKNFDLVQMEKEKTRVVNMQIKFRPKPNQATGANQKMSEIRNAVSSFY